MKLKQRLATILAATMLVTAMPVSTFARSENYINKQSTVKKDGGIGFYKTTTSSGIKIENRGIYLDVNVEDPFDSAFFLTLEKAEWAEKDIIASALMFPGSVIDKSGNIVDSEGEVLMLADDIPSIFPLDENGRYSEENAVVKMHCYSDDVMIQAIGTVEQNLKIPIFAIAQGGTAVIYVDGEGSTISSSEHDLAVTPKGDEAVEIYIDEDDIPSFYEEGTLAPITFKEIYPGAFGAASEDDRTVVLTIDKDDYEFSYIDKVTLKGERGLGGTYEVEAELDKYRQELTFVLPSEVSSAKGYLKLEGLKVEPSGRSVEAGDFYVEIECDMLDDYQDLLVGYVTEYGVTLKPYKDKIVDIVSGRKTSVEVVLKESVKDSIRVGRELNFELSEGYFGTYDEDSKKSDIEQIKKYISLPSSLEITDTLVDRDDRFIGFSVKVKELDSSISNEFKIKFDLIAPLDFSGEIELKVDGRAIGDEVSTIIAESMRSMDVEVETIVLAEGLKDQKGGKLTIVETEEKMLDKGTIFVAIPDDEGIKFVDVPTITVNEDSGMKISDAKIVDDDDNDLHGIEFKITRASRKEPAEIVLEDFTFTVSGLVAYGTTDAYISGTALGVDASDSIIKKDFIEVKSKESLKEQEATPTVTSFRIGSSVYVVNDQVKAMDVAPYIKNDRTMVPVRYLADAFGLSEQDIFFQNGITTLFLKDGNVLQLKVNSNVAIVNGMQIPLSQATEIKDNRTMVPIGEIGRLMNLEVDWNASTQTATFVSK